VGECCVSVELKLSVAAEESRGGRGVTFTKQRNQRKQRREREGGVRSVVTSFHRVSFGRRIVR
jgi:hypothetical protein